MRHRPGPPSKLGRGLGQGRMGRREGRETRLSRASLPSTASSPISRGRSHATTVIDAALASAAQVVEAEVQAGPYVGARRDAEPMNAVVKFDGDTVRIWSGSQMQTIDQAVAGAIFGVPPAKGAHRHQIRRRLVRAPRGAERGLPRRSRDGGQGVGQARSGQARLATRGRHAGAAITVRDVPAPGQGRPRRGGESRRLEACHRRAVDLRRHGI